MENSNAYGLYGRTQANRLRSAFLLVGFVALLLRLLRPGSVLPFAPQPAEVRLRQQAR
jgi:hypothetical protein